MRPWAPLLALLAALAGCEADAPVDAAAPGPPAPTQSAPLELQPRPPQPDTTAHPRAAAPQVAVGDCGWLDAEGPATRLFPVSFGEGAPAELANVCFGPTSSPVSSGVRYLTVAGPLETELRPRVPAQWQLRVAVPWPLPDIGTTLAVALPPTVDERRGHPAAGEVYVYADEAPLAESGRLGGDVDWRGVAGELSLVERAPSGLSGVALLEVTLARTVEADNGLDLVDERFEVRATMHVVE